MTRHSGCPVEIIAHRGASAEAPENTLAAVELAWSQDVDAVEVDVHLSRDGCLVVLHDATLQRTARRSGRVRDLTAAELTATDVGSWRGSRFSAERIPLLADVLAMVPPGRRLFVEIKCGVDAIAVLRNDVAASGLAAAAVVVISFHPDVTEEARRRMPHHEVRRVVRQTASNGKDWSPSAAEVVEQASRQGLDGVHLSHTAAVDPAAIERFSRAGLSTAVWTVNALADARRLVDAGVRSLTTDDPRTLIAGLR